jgi:predicted DNA binding CopG/RHH family protein
VKKAPPRPVQFFSDEYLERCRAMKPGEVLEFLESFRLLHARASSRSRLISLKVPESLLDAFRARCRLEGLRYQTQIKRLMSDWLG